MSARAQGNFERFSGPEDFSLATEEGVLLAECAQRAVLGAALIENSLMYGPIATLSVGDLVGSWDQIVYALMLELSADDQRFELTTIVQALEERGQLEQAGGCPYMASLIDGAVTEPSLVKRHVESIQRIAQLRRLRSVGESLVRKASETGADPSCLLLDFSKVVTELQMGRDLNGDLLPYKPSDLSRRPEILTLSKVVAQEVDWLWRPYLPNQMLAMLSGDPGAGKTYIALAICAAVTLGHEPNTGRPSKPADVLCLSVENSPEYVLRPRFDTLGGAASRFHILRGSVAGEGNTLCAVP
jgi:replicative DNA helicase